MSFCNCGFFFLSDLPAPSYLTVFLLPSLVEAALGRMIDGCRSGPVKVCAESLVSLLGLTDKRAAVRICSLYAKVEIIFSGFMLLSQASFKIFFSLQDKTVDLRHIYFSVAALSGLVRFKSLLHIAFPVKILSLFTLF